MRLHRVHEAILPIVKASPLAPSILGDPPGTDDAILRRVFTRFRRSSASSAGFRLTLDGYDLVKHHHGGYKVDLEGGRFGHREMIYFEARMKVPYLVEKDSLTLFHEDAAMMLTLMRGDLGQFIGQQGDIV